MAGPDGQQVPRACFLYLVDHQQLRKTAPSPLINVARTITPTSDGRSHTSSSSTGRINTPPHICRCLLTCRAHIPGRESRVGGVVCHGTKQTPRPQVARVTPLLFASLSRCTLSLPVHSSQHFTLPNRNHIWQSRALLKASKLEQKPSRSTLFQVVWALSRTHGEAAKYTAPFVWGDSVWLRHYPSIEPQSNSGPETESSG